MDPVMLVLVPGILGGILIAAFLFRIRPSQTTLDPLRRHPRSTDIINMARIRVDGVGGLGLVAMALTIAWFVLRIRQQIAIGLGLGVILALVLIVLRRKRGPMPSSGRTPGAHSTLPLDDRPTPTASTRDARQVPGARVRDAAA